MRAIGALFRREVSSSRETARERLRFILINDRARIPAHVLNAIKDELIQVLSRHLDIDEAGISISVSHGKEQDKLVADIPIAGLKRPSSGR